MKTISDYHCTADNQLPAIPLNVLESEEISFPEAYLNQGDMVRLSLAIRRETGSLVCVLPFCHTLEAEALGGMIQMGDGTVGPRTGEYICQDVEEILRLPSMDFSKGRIHETLLACRELRSMGEHVLFEISGPFTILNGLIDVTKVLRAMRKQPDVMDAVLRRLVTEIVRFAEQVQMQGADFISYADSAGSLPILGPKLLGEITERYTYPMLKELQNGLKADSMLLLCPKTTLALIGTGLGAYVNHPMGSSCTYAQACMDMKGIVPIAGQMCVKNQEYRLTDGMFKEIRLR